MVSASRIFKVVKMHPPGLGMAVVIGQLGLDPPRMLLISQTPVLASTLSMSSGNTFNDIFVCLFLTVFAEAE